MEQLLALAHQIHGAMGSAIEYDLHYYTRRMKASELMLRNADLDSDILSQALLSSVDICVKRNSRRATQSAQYQAFWQGQVCPLLDASISEN